MKEITQEQYDKLIDCEVFRVGEKVPTKAKFLNRGRSSVNVVKSHSDGTFFISNVHCYDVMVDGIILPYKDKFSFTNPKKPF